MSDPNRHHRTVKLTVLALAAVYAACFSIQTCLGHSYFKTWAFDLGTFDQGIWLAGHATDHFVTVRGLPLLGDHVRFLSFVLAPIYWIWDDVRALLILQSVAIAAGAWFLCRIGLRELPGRPWLVLVMCASYLINPAVQNLNLDHAHPDAFATTFILASVDFLRAGRLLPFALAAALAMSCKEDVPLVFVALGLVLMLDRRQRRLGFVIALASSAYFMLCVAVILPYFNGAGFFRYGKQGFLAGLWYQGHDPRWLLGRFFGVDGIRYLLELGFANLYLFLLAPLTLAPAVPALVANLVSSAWYMRSLEFHYQTSVVPFLYIATMDGLARIGFLRGAVASATASAGDAVRTAGTAATRTLALVGATAPGLLLISAVASNLAWSRVPLNDPRALLSAWEDNNSQAGLAKVRELIALVPKDAVVSADYSVVPHLSHRRAIYLFPNPFEISNWGVDGENPHDPDSVEYILVRNVHSREALIDRVNALVAEGTFVRIDGDDDVGLYRRVGAPAANAGCGDWNGDARVDDEDMRRIVHAIMKRRRCPLRVCDADGDGTLRIGDAQLVGKHIKDPSAKLNCPP
ncbi:MAG: DUF2079 domain-containing protein [Candidatus Binatia bacterium]